MPGGAIRTTHFVMRPPPSNGMRHEIRAVPQRRGGTGPVRTAAAAASSVVERDLGIGARRPPASPAGPVPWPGAPSRGSIRWCRPGPHARFVTDDVARRARRDPERVSSRVGVLRVLDGDLDRGRRRPRPQVAPGVHRDPGKSRGERVLDGSVDRPSLGDAAEVEVDARGQGQGAVVHLDLGPPPAGSGRVQVRHGRRRGARRSLGRSPRRRARRGRSDRTTLGPHRRHRGRLARARRTAPTPESRSLIAFDPREFAVAAEAGEPPLLDAKRLRRRVAARDRTGARRARGRSILRAHRAEGGGLRHAHDPPVLVGAGAGGGAGAGRGRPSERRLNHDRGSRRRCHDGRPVDDDDPADHA